MKALPERRMNLGAAMGVLIIPLAPLFFGQAATAATIAEIFDDPARYEGNEVLLSHVAATDGLPEPWFRLVDMGLDPWSITDRSRKEICVTGRIPSTHPMPSIMNITATVETIDGYPYLKDPKMES